MFSDTKLVIDPVVLRALGFEGHVPVDENRSTRNFLMFMNTANIAYNRNPKALAHFLPICNAALFTNSRKFLVGANNQRPY